MADDAGVSRLELTVFMQNQSKSPLVWLTLLRFDYIKAKQRGDAASWQQLAAEYSRRGAAIPKELRRSEEMFALDVDEARCKMYVFMSVPVFETTTVA
jgi:hypothetical protein